MSLVKNQFPVALARHALPQAIANENALALSRLDAGEVEIRAGEDGRAMAAGVKRHFYIGSDDDAERCWESFRCKRPIDIGGTDTLTGRVNSYSGVVVSVEVSAKGPGERWRITIDSA